MGNSYIKIKNIFRHDLEKHNKDFTENHLLLYVYIQRFNTYRNEINFCMKWLFDDLNIKKTSTKQELFKCFFDLIDWELINLLDNSITVDNINKNTRLIVNIPNDLEDFTLIYDKAIDKILNSKLDIRLIKTMLFLYIDIESRIDNKGYCYPSFEIFMKDLNTTSHNRINNALKKLKELKLIDYNNIGQKIINNKVVQSNNIYVSCINPNYKSILERVIKNKKQEYEKNKIKIANKKKSNKQRSIKQILNNLWIKYDNGNITKKEKDELKELEEQYYNLIKSNKQKLNEIDFKLLKINNNKEFDYSQLPY